MINHAAYENRKTVLKMKCTARDLTYLFMVSKKRVAAFGNERRNRKACV